MGYDNIDRPPTDCFPNFWGKLEEDFDIKERFIESEYNWELLPPPEKEYCIIVPFNPKEEKELRKAEQEARLHNSTKENMVDNTADLRPQSYHEAFWKMLDENPNIRDRFTECGIGEPLSPEERVYCIAADEEAKKAAGL